MDIVYFELNHWSADRYYPDAEPFISWMSDYYETKEEEDKSWIVEPEKFDAWCKEQKIVVVVATIDMSVNFCVTAPKEWVLKTCPELLTEYTQFLRIPEEDNDLPDGRFDIPFLEYTKENIGANYAFENEKTDGYDIKNAHEIIE